MSNPRGRDAPVLRPVVVTGLVVRTTAGRKRNSPRRRMTVRIDDGGREIVGPIPPCIMFVATTLAGRRIRFLADIDERTGRFRRAKHCAILPPPHLA